MHEQVRRNQIEMDVHDQIAEVLDLDFSTERHRKFSQIISTIESTGVELDKWVQSIRRRDLRKLLLPLAEALSIQEVPGGKPLIESVFQSFPGQSARGLFIRTEEPASGFLAPIKVVVDADGKGRNIVIPQAYILERAMPAVRASALDYVSKYSLSDRQDATESSIYVYLGEPADTSPLHGSLDGPSLGLLIAILSICHFCGATFPRTASATGTLTASGSVGSVQLLPKIEAAVKEGITQIFIPRLNEMERKELEKYLPHVKEVEYLSDAINILVNPSHRFPWYMAKQRYLLRERKVDAKRFKTRRIRIVREKKDDSSRS